MALPRARSVITDPFTATLKLTGNAVLTVSFSQFRKTTDGAEWIGIVIKSDPRGSYKLSHLIDLVVDGEPKTTAFQLRETQTTLTWEVRPAVYVPLVVFGSSS